MTAIYDYENKITYDDETNEVLFISRTWYFPLEQLDDIEAYELPNAHGAWE